MRKKFAAKVKFRLRIVTSSARRAESLQLVGNFHFTNFHFAVYRIKPRACDLHEKVSLLLCAQYFFFFGEKLLHHDDGCSLTGAIDDSW